MIEGQEIRARWYHRFLNPYRVVGEGGPDEHGNAWVTMAPRRWYPMTWVLRWRARREGASA
jgi:hypothetical protein